MLNSTTVSPGCDEMPPHNKNYMELFNSASETLYCDCLGDSAILFLTFVITIGASEFEFK